MSSQRSDWRERLHPNPSRMEQELAIKLQDNGITYLNRTIALPATYFDHGRVVSEGISPVEARCFDVGSLATT